MDFQWIKISPSITRGVGVINQLNESRFEQFLRRIVMKLKLQTTEIFTEDEREKLEKIFIIGQEELVLSVRTLQYIFKRMIKYIFMPINLKNDLKSIGLNNEKANSLIKVWSAETRATLNDLGSMSSDKNNDYFKFSWKINAELSSDYQKKCKIPKAYLSIIKATDENEMELTHPELYSMYLQFESIQNELDHLIA